MATARKLIGDDYAEDRNRERKGDIAAAMERAFAETAGETEGFAASVVTKTTRWLPEGMVFAGSSDADVDLKSDAGEADLGGAELDEDAMSDMGDEPDALPAFLSSDAA